jgi:hypothetical protein
MQEKQQVARITHRDERPYGQNTRARWKQRRHECCSPCITRKRRGYSLQVNKVNRTRKRAKRNA